SGSESPMGLNRSLVALTLALALAGCASLPTPNVVAGPPDPLLAPADLDGLAYGRSGPVQPPVIPVAGPVLPVPADLMPGPAPGGMEPYTLDSGDRLRVVVFGQDGLSNSYIVDVGGKIALPLIGAVSARALTTGQLARVIADR